MKKTQQEIDQDKRKYDFIINDTSLTEKEKARMVGQLWMSNKKDKIKSWFKRKEMKEL